jgi:hypothetical protein
MTFGAMAAWQAWVLVAGAAGLAVWLFRLRVRPRRVLVPSLLLWRRVLSDSRELTFWERIRRAVSLVVTAAIAVALALALARPARAIGGTEASRGPLMIVIDSSWSMLARTRGGETRWARAIAEARRLASASTDEELALATTTDGLVEGPTTDLALIETALDRIAPSGGSAAAWPQLAGRDVVHFITDGSIARPLERGVMVHSVFEPAANVGITAFDIRPSLGGAGAGEAYLEVANFGPAQAVHVTLRRGTASLLDRSFDLAAGEILRQVVRLDRGGDPAVRAHIEAPGNALAVDDEAFAWFDQARPLRVTVVSDRPAWLVRLFAGNPDVTATFAAPAAYRPGQEDAVIFDRWMPPDPPERPALYFAPPAQGWLSVGAGDLSSGADVETRPRWMAAGSHPVVRGVDPLTLAIASARVYRSVQLMPIAASARGTPLVYVNKAPARARFVIVGFGADESNLAAAPAFPVLVGNALTWLARAADAGQRRPGEASFDVALVRLTGPGGRAIPLARLAGEAVGVLRLPGLYLAEGAGSRTTFAVNINNPDVSNLMRTSAVTMNAPASVSAGARGPWWLYCAGAAFAAALAEWWTWLRRITV